MHWYPRKFCNFRENLSIMIIIIVMIWYLKYLEIKVGEWKVFDATKRKWCCEEARNSFGSSECDQAAPPLLVLQKQRIYEREQRHFFFFFFFNGFKLGFSLGYTTSLYWEEKESYHHVHQIMFIFNPNDFLLHFYRGDIDLFIWLAKSIS